MKGLLLKDLYMAAKYCRSFLLVIVVFLSISLLGEGNLFFGFYPCLLCGMIPASLLSYDERSKWNVYSGTLPYTRAQLVSGKYVFGLCIEAIIFVLSGVTQAVRMNLAGTFTLEVWTSTMGILLAMTLLTPAISLPFMFKLGVEKGRIAYYVALAVVCGVTAALTKVIETEIKTPSLFGSALPMLCLGAIALYAISWYLSIVWYQRREIS